MLARFDPLREMTTLRRDIERLFDESLFRREWPAFETEVLNMPMDIYEEGNNLMVKASVPGLKPEEIKIEVRGDVLHIYGETKKEEDKKERDLSTGVAGRQEPLHYHLKEHRFARYERSVGLPFGVNAEKATAVFDNGMLTLTLPKTEVTKTKQIPIKTMAKA